MGEGHGGGGASGSGGHAAVHPAVGARTTARGEPANARRCWWRSSHPWFVGEEEKKEEREMVGGCLFLPWWRIKRPIFPPPSGCMSPSISVFYGVGLLFEICWPRLSPFFLFRRILKQRILCKSYSCANYANSSHNCWISIRWPD
jgi:hypothetical protein